MTREEAIEVIKLAMAQVEWDYPMDYAAAFDMAIKALEQEPTTKNDLGVDCIDRAEVLKLMQDNWHTHNGDWAMQESMDDIRALPSVTPQEPFINKSCVSSGVCEHDKNKVLDNIRAEIKGMTPTYHNPDWSITDLVPISEVLKLVDKYKAESE